MFVRLSLLPLLLAGCAPTVASFTDDFVPTFCAYAVPCAESLNPVETGDTAEASTASCEAELTDYIETQDADDGCTFDAGNAQKCLDSLEAPECSTSGLENVRDECENVFTGDDCELNLAALL